MVKLLGGCKRAVEFVMCAWVFRVAVGVAAGLGCSGLALAQTEASTAAVITADDLGAFFDEQVPLEMRKADVAGSVIVVVKDGSVLFTRGYGYADVEHKVPVSPSETLFRIASISKAVTATAVMQLVEQGKIDLDADIAMYLDFPVPAAFGKPITMRNLLSHTAGFEETLRGRWVDRFGSMRDYLVRQMPRRLFAPGTVPAYSTYGTTLAGYIVERVSGQAFGTYVDRHIFAPLGMRSSSFAQPLPPALAPLLSKGYKTAGGPAQPFDTAQAAPAASMSSSAMDMARFMLAHLGGTDGAGPRVLKPATLAQMHAVQFRHHPDGPGVALGLYEMDLIGPKVIGHTGDIPNFHSAMYLLPDQRIGLFIVQNTEAGGAMRSILLKRFARRYLTPQQPAALARYAGVDESEQLQGSYRTSWRFDSSPPSLRDLLGQDTVRVVKPGVLVIGEQTGSDGKPVQWHEVAAGVWQGNANPQDRRYFRKSAGGNWEMSSNFNPTYVMQKTPWHRSRLLMLSVLLLSIVTVLLSALAWPVSAMRRLYTGRRPDLSPRLRRVRNTVRLAGLLILSPWLLYGCIALVIANNILFVSSPACAVLLRGVQALAWLAVGGTIGAIWAAMVSWRCGDASWTSRVHHTVFGLACLGASAMAWQGSFLVWDGRY
ncbi:MULTISPECIES: serine hydrolase [unclassified Duganella]|uniref:serine hydrolase domain-containing protein n=1 Tax=unclassified Duganella TaxID=2636909 RepID=UPI001314C2E4|nr:MULTISPECIES: serine hydrolase domain-containing protein [unclassified Duganella]